MCQLGNQWSSAWEGTPKPSCGETGELIERSDSEKVWESDADPAAVAALLTQFVGILKAKDIATWPEVCERAAHLLTALPRSTGAFDSEKVEAVARGMFDACMARRYEGNRIPTWPPEKELAEEWRSHARAAIAALTESPIP